jgi:hypothetical protein
MNWWKRFFYVVRAELILGALEQQSLGYITKICRQQAEVIQNHDNENVRSIGQGEAPHRKYKTLKLGGGQAYDRSSV